MLGPGALQNGGMSALPAAAGLVKAGGWTGEPCHEQQSYCSVLGALEHRCLSGLVLESGTMGPGCFFS